ncbi:MAG: sugar phosphate nucleotidyltransferase [Lachnospiraceae bacterium]
MKDVMGIIYTGEKDSFLRELTLQRAIAAVPVAGRYRVIDFFVSAMVNSGVRNVGVIMQKNYTQPDGSNLAAAARWDLARQKRRRFAFCRPDLRENAGRLQWFSWTRSISNMNRLGAAAVL